MPQFIFKDVFICHSWLTESWYCCNHEKLNNKRLLFICLASPLLMDPLAVCLSSKKINKFENKVGALCFMRSFSVFNCQSSLLCICLSTSFFSSSLVWKSDEFIGCGGLPVEVKRESGSASDSPIILYGSSCGRAFITLNYMPRLLPPTPQPVQDGPGLIVLSSYPGGT